MLRIPIKIFPEYFTFNLIDHIWNQGQTYFLLEVIIEISPAVLAPKKMQSETFPDNSINPKNLEF